MKNKFLFLLSVVGLIFLCSSVLFAETAKKTNKKFKTSTPVLMTAAITSIKELQSNPEAEDIIRLKCVMPTRKLRRKTAKIVYVMEYDSMCDADASAETEILIEAPVGKAVKFEAQAFTQNNFKCFAVNKRGRVSRSDSDFYLATVKEDSLIASYGENARPCESPTFYSK